MGGGGTGAIRCASGARGERVELKAASRGMAAGWWCDVTSMGLQSTHMAQRSPVPRGHTLQAWIIMDLWLLPISPSVPPTSPGDKAPINHRRTTPISPLPASGAPPLPSPRPARRPPTCTNRSTRCCRHLVQVSYSHCSSCCRRFSDVKVVVSVTCAPRREVVVGGGACLRVCVGGAGAGCLFLGGGGKRRGVARRAKAAGTNCPATSLASHFAPCAVATCTCPSQWDAQQASTCHPPAPYALPVHPNCGPGPGPQNTASSSSYPGSSSSKQRPPRPPHLGPNVVKDGQQDRVKDAHPEGLSRVVDVSFREEGKDGGAGVGGWGRMREG